MSVAKPSVSRLSHSSAIARNYSLKGPEIVVPVLCSVHLHVLFTHTMTIIILNIYANFTIVGCQFPKGKSTTNF